MKKTILAAAMAGSVLLLGACSSNEALVKVGKESITKEEFYQELKTANGTATLQSMIENEVLSAKYKVTDKEVQDEIKRLKSNFSSDEEFQSALTQYNVNTTEQLNKFTRDTLLRYKAISDGVKVSDSDLKKYYETNKDNYITIDASHILVEKKEEAEKLLKELKGGADFAKLAKENSKDGSALNGGSLGTFGKGKMVEEFEKAAFALKENEISDVVKTEFGYHIIKVNKINEKNLKNAKEDIKKDYLMENGKSYPEVMAKLLKNAKVEIEDKEYKDLVTDMIDQYNTSATQAAATSQSATTTGN